MLSHDNMVFMDLAPPEMLGRLREHFHATASSTTRSVPALGEKGVSEDDINTMLVENPRNYFSRSDCRPTARTRLGIS